MRILGIVALFCAFSTADAALARPTFNGTRTACQQEIEVFLGDVSWAGHAVRVRGMTFVDSGRSLDLIIWKPVRVMYFDVRTRHHQALNQALKGAFVSDGIEDISNPSIFLGLYREVRGFVARRAYDAPVWYVFRESPSAQRWNNVRLFSTDPSGVCIQTSFVDSWFVPSSRHLFVEAR